MPLERTIQKAIVRETGEVIDNLDEYFDDRKSSYLIRQESNRDNINFECLCCGQKLVVSQSKNYNIYLKHLPNSEYCELKDENLSTKEIEVYNNILDSKESERHKFLKKRIGELLKIEKNISEIRIDDHFIFNDRRKKRRPDVYCKYLDKEIVFEIQLSQLSQKYILGRYDFYKAKGIYLVWILDYFDVRGSTSTELDIKYLSKHQNYFRFIDESNHFKLKCEYKYTFLNPVNNQFQDKWNEVNIGLDKLNFDDKNIEVYFHNFLKEKEELELLQTKNREIIEEKRKQKEEEREQDRVVCKVYEFLEDIGREKANEYNPDFNKLKNQLREFTEVELKTLNSRLDLNNSNRIFNWIRNANSKDRYFLDFILSSLNIEFNVNKLDNNGNSVFYHLFINEEIPYIHNKEEFLKILFKAGYKFNLEDETTLKSYLLQVNLNDLFLEHKTLYIIANRTPKWLIDKLFETRIRKVVMILESFLQKTLISYNYPNNVWLNLAQNSIQHYPEYWTYILSAIKFSKLYDTILSNDKKGSLKDKINNFTELSYKEDKDFTQLFMNLYPELIYTE